MRIPHDPCNAFTARSPQFFSPALPSQEVVAKYAIMEENQVDLNILCALRRLPPPHPAPTPPPGCLSPPPPSPSIDTADAPVLGAALPCGVAALSLPALAPTQPRPGRRRNDDRLTVLTATFPLVRMRSETLQVASPPFPLPPPPFSTLRTRLARPAHACFRIASDPIPPTSSQ